MKKNDHITLDITDMSVAGEGIGRFDGMPFFVANAVVGDRITAGITKLKKTYGYARLISVYEASPFRVVPKCAVSKKCGGCSVMSLDYEKQLEIKQSHVMETLVRIGGLQKDVVRQVSEPIIGMEEPYHFRNKAQYPVGEDAYGKTVIGFYAPHSHRIVEPEVDGCMIGQPEDKEIIGIFKKFMEKYDVSAYDEKSGRGMIRHLLIRYGFATKEMMVCIVANGSSIDHADKLIEMLLEWNKDESEYNIKSIVLNENTARTNVILGRRTVTLWGEEKIKDELLGKVFEISANSFYQVNPLQTAKLYSKAIEYAGLTGEEVVWDLCCGVGTISLCMASKAKKVVGIEVVPQAIEDAKRNAKLNGIDNVSFIAGKAEDILKDFKKTDYEGSSVPAPQVVVVDPPRKGLAAETIEAILEAFPERVVYVSCNPSTLARDIKMLCEGGYEIKKCTPVDQFGHGMHVETVCLLDKKKSKDYVELGVDADDYYRIKDSE